MTILSDTINEIDPQFPRSGKDNSSQGFRENFAKIQNSLLLAASEIEDLQNKAVLKQPLTGHDTLDAFTDFDFNKLSNVVTSNFYGTAWAPAGTQTEPVVTDLIQEGKEYFKYTVDNGFFSIDFVNWPVDKDGRGVYAKIRVELVSDGTARPINFASSGRKIFDTTFDESVITTPSTAGESIIFDVWSFDKGKSVYFSKVGIFRELP